jgi:ubiquinone/menaquinone biosynthesis C-methylase UbiE
MYKPKDILELIKAVRIIGLGNLLRLARAQRIFWRDLIRGYYATHAIRALFNIGLLDALRERGSIDLGEFARAENLDETTLKQVGDYLFCIGLFTKSGESCALTPDGRIMVDVARGWFEATDGYGDVYYHLEDIIRGKKRYHTDVFRKPFMIARGSSRMEAQVYFPIVADIVSQGGYKNVLDIGCGDCGFLTALCRSNPQVTGYGIDIAAESITSGRNYLKEHGLEDRILLSLLHLGEATELPADLSGVDVATVFFVLHEVLYHGEAAVIAFLQNFRRLFPGVPLIVVEVNRSSLEDTRTSKGMGPEYYLQHDLTHQVLVDREKWISLFKAAGIASIEERELRFAKSDIFILR